MLQVVDVTIVIEATGSNRLLILFTINQSIIIKKNENNDIHRNNNNEIVTYRRLFRRKIEYCHSIQ